MKKVQNSTSLKSLANKYLNIPFYDLQIPIYDAPNDCLDNIKIENTPRKPKVHIEEVC